MYPRPQQLRHTSDEELAQFITSLKDKSTPTAFLHVLADSSLKLIKHYSSTFNATPKLHIENVKYQLKCEIQPLSLTCIHIHCNKLVQQLTCTSEEIHAIERATVGQRIRKRWHEERYGRLTASNFGRTCNCCIQLLLSLLQ